MLQAQANRNHVSRSDDDFGFWIALQVQQPVLPLIRNQRLSWHRRSARSKSMDADAVTTVIDLWTGPRGSRDDRIRTNMRGD